MPGFRIYRKAIKRASDIVGGVYPLAAKLAVQPEVLLHWLEDRGEPDEQSFARAVEIILDRDGAVPWTAAELETELAGRQALRK